LNLGPWSQIERRKKSNLHKGSVVEESMGVLEQQSENRRAATGEIHFVPWY